MSALGSAPGAAGAPVPGPAPLPALASETETQAAETVEQNDIDEKAEQQRIERQKSDELNGFSTSDKASELHVENRENHKEGLPSSAHTLAPSGSGDAEKRSVRSSVAGKDDRIPTPRAATPVAPKKKGLFSKKKKPEGEEEDATDLIKPVPITQLFRYATKFEMMINFVGILLAIASGAAAPLMTLIFGRLSNTFTEFQKVVIVSENLEYGETILGRPVSADEVAGLLAGAKKMIKKEAGDDALYLMAIGLGMAVCIYGYMVIWNWTSERQGRRIRQLYLQAVMRQEIAYFDDLGAGEVATRIQTDCHLVQQGLSEKVPIALSFLATFVTGFVLAYIRLPKLAGAMTAILPVIMICGGIMGFAMSKFTTKSLQFVSRGGTIAEEVISSIRTVKAFATAKLLGHNYDKNVSLSRNAGIKGAMIEGSGLAVMFFAIYSAYALAFFYGGILVYNGEANVGQVINAFMSVLIGSFSMAMVAPEIQTVTKAQAAAAKLFETIDRVPAIDSSDPAGEKPAEVIGTIAFEDVKFHYPSRPNIPILKGLTTTFEEGKTCALVGASGSGKSTVIQLIERFYDPAAGAVKLDGRDVRSLNLTWYRQQIGLVSQEPVLFATTVRGNVEHGLIGSKWENAPDEERFELVKKACVAANADGFISKLPEGYDTIVGERGMLLSGGQKQRVAIARAIVSDPKILLLDEATSALDGLSERVVQNALDKAAIGRTTIVVAHRLATIRDADKILVMGDGEILEQGTHESLLAIPDGAYAQLVANQKLSQTAAEKASADVDVDSDEEEDVDAVPGSPVKEKIGLSLQRSVTGRSVASAMLDQQRLRREEAAAAEAKIPFSRLFIRLIKLNGAHWKWYTLGTIGAVCSGMIYPALAILFGKAMGDFALPGPQLKDALRHKALWYFIVSIIAAIAIWFQQAGFSRTGWELITRLRRLAFRAVMRHDVEWFDEDENATGAVTSSLSDHPQKVQGLFGVTLGSIIQSIATLLGGCIIGLCYAPLLALVGIACIPLVVSSGYIRLRVVVLKEQKVKKWYSASAQMASEATGAVRTVASLTREKDIDRLYSESLQTPFNISIKTAYTSQALYAVSQGIAMLAMALVFYVGALWISEQRYDSATFFTALTATLFASMQAGNVFMFVPDASSANSGARSLFKLLDYEPEIDDDSTDGIVLDPAQVKGHLRLDNIHFRYPSRPGVRVLRKLSIEVPPGKYIALVGPSGCGKSTTIQLLERFYDPQAGSVTMDGVDIRELNLASYRSFFALVSQEPTLYAGTIRFNILLGAAKPMEEVTEEELVQACKDANIYDFITSLPDGFETEVGGKGSQLSGGQKQRIAIARALIRDPKILLLDEATAALDSTSERVVQAALDNASKGRSVVAIAHRLSTIQNADMIYFVSEGAVVERGTHAELIAKGGAYFELVQMQNLSARQ